MAPNRGTVDPTRQGIAAPAPDPADELPGAAPVGVDDARALVAGWPRDGSMTLFGLHQIAIALADEVEQLRHALVRYHATLRGD